MSWVTAGHEIESEVGLLFLHVQTSLSITKEYPCEIYFCIPKADKCVSPVVK